jgi:hypothetical protein
MHRARDKYSKLLLYHIGCGGCLYTNDNRYYFCSKCGQDDVDDRFVTFDKRTAKDPLTNDDDP